LTTFHRNQAFLFDLDGTLVDSVYEHVLAWQDALDRSGIDLSVWRIHRKIGMSGGLFANALLRETGRQVTVEDAVQLRRLHAEAYAERSDRVRPLPGARELLKYLSGLQFPWAIATSGHMETAGPVLERLDVPAEIPVITRDQVERAKPDPDLFLAAAEQLSIDIEDCVVVGDSVWDLLAARRVRALGGGLALRWPRHERARTRRCLPCLRRPRRPPAAPGRGGSPNGLNPEGLRKARLSTSRFCASGTSEQRDSTHAGQLALVGAAPCDHCCSASRRQRHRRARIVAAG
jgi:HAD superfamily hydrolase (TIGR01549 family)